MKNKLKMFIKSIWISFVIIGALILCIYYFYMYEQKDTSEPVDIIYVSKSTSDTAADFWDEIVNGMHAAGVEYNANITVFGSQSEDDIITQTYLLYKAIRMEPDVIILSSTDYYYLVQPSEDVVEAGIELITIESDINCNASSSFISTNNFEAGVAAGNKMIELVGKNQRIAIMASVKNSDATIDKLDGIYNTMGTDTIKRDGGTYYCGASDKTAFEKAIDILNENPEIKGFIALDEPSTIGVTRAIDNLGLKNEVSIVGFDSSFFEIQYMEQDLIDSLIVQKPFNMGYWAVRNAVMAHGGGNYSPQVYTGFLVVDKETLYNKENERFVFSFSR